MIYDRFFIVFEFLGEFLEGDDNFLGFEFLSDELCFLCIGYGC